MSKRKKQICVVGLGHFGWELAIALAGNCEVLAIDRDQTVVDEIADQVQRALVLDVHDEAALASVIPRDIDEVIVSMGENLESSILCTLYLKRLGVPVVRIKALSDDHAVVLRQLGADEVIFPERQTARRLAAKIMNPNLLDFVPLGRDFQVQEVRMPPALAGQTLAQANLRGLYNVFVLSVLRPEPEGMQFMPGPDFRLQLGDLLVIIGREDDLRRMQASQAIPSGSAEARPRSW
jgi:trk system potassium uptake protein TrkA